MSGLGCFLDSVLSSLMQGLSSNLPVNGAREQDWTEEDRQNEPAVSSTTPQPGEPALHRAVRRPLSHPCFCDNPRKNRGPRHLPLISTTVPVLLLLFSAAPSVDCSSLSIYPKPIGYARPREQPYQSNAGPLCLAESGDVGVCMFLRSCLENRGKLAGACAKSFFLASCCVLPNTTMSATGHLSTPGPFAEILKEISISKSQKYPPGKQRLRPASADEDGWPVSGENDVGDTVTTEFPKRTPALTPKTTKRPLSTTKTSPAWFVTRKWTYTKSAFYRGKATTPSADTLVTTTTRSHWQNKVAATPSKNQIRYTISTMKSTTKSKSYSAYRRPSTASPSPYAWVWPSAPTTTLQPRTSASTSTKSSVSSDSMSVDVNIKVDLQSLEIMKNSVANAQADTLEINSKNKFNGGNNFNSDGTWSFSNIVTVPPTRNVSPANRARISTGTPATSAITTTVSTPSTTPPSTTTTTAPITTTATTTTTTIPTTATTTTSESTTTTTATTTAPPTSTMESTTTPTTTTSTTEATTTVESTLVWHTASPVTEANAGVSDAPVVDVISVDQDKNGQISIQLSEICGVTPLLWKRIVGGSEAKFGQYPWEVSLRRIVGFISSHRCGAVLVHPKWILTAAHCASEVPTVYSSIPMDRMIVRIGEYDLSDSNTVFPHVDLRVSERIIHEKFNFLTFENDVALLRLAEPVNLAPHIIPICLAPFKNYTGSMGTIAGWGRTSQGGALPPRLHQVSVPFISKKECESWFDIGDRHQDIEQCFICAGYKNGGRDACQGDSGGPVIQQVDGRWSLVGIVSWGIGCAEPNLPGVSTLVPLYAEWVQQKTSGDVYMPEFFANKYGKPPPISALSKNSTWKGYN